jgi:hypothetical protein
MLDPARLPTFDYPQTLPMGFRFPARMSVLPLASGTLALVSPIPIDDALAREIEVLGEVGFLIAPNLLHHLYLAAASERYPDARVLAPPGLRSKRPDLRIDATLDAALPDELAASIEVLHIAGAPTFDEYALFHSSSRTLVVTDLVFNVRADGPLAHLVLFMVGCHGKLAQSRVWRIGIKDRPAARESMKAVLALPFETLVMAHGEIVGADARAKLAHALRWLASPEPALAL